MRLPRPLLLTLAAFGLALCLFASGAFYNSRTFTDRIYPRIDRFLSGLGSNQPEAVPTLAVTLADPPTFAVETPTSIATPKGEDTASPLQTTQQPNNLTTQSPTPEPTAVSVIYDLPASITLEGARYEPQLYNNCGPATLTAALVYWGWRGSEPDELVWYAAGKDVRWQRDIASVIKPNKSDKNVMAYELANYAIEQAGLSAEIRYGGDIDVIKRFVANGFPVIIERGFREEEHGQVGQGWEGHYGLITGYDDNARKFLTQDSFKGANYWRDYDAEVKDWRDFNYLYIILYPGNRAAEVTALLGPDADVGANYNRALAKAQADAARHTDPLDLAFDWFNVGTSLQLLERNEDAALAFDQARSYGILPYRMLWYQTFMYKAYFYTERYQDVIDLANVTLQTPGMEESLYWRGWAYYQLGDLDRAVADMRAALDAHPDWDQALAALAQWGVSP
ncbi:MAG: C39 family peptidase [Chloroflexi bacterium]|nr:C39 family peptidase [Chloroflexota bacterium]